MRWVVAVVAVCLIGSGLAFWLTGGDRLVTAWALEGQRTAQEAMAGALRRLRAGEGAAIAGLLAVCFGYGFFHAAGPGHGKLLIGGYGAARAVGAVRLSAVALASSLAQGATAVLLVGTGVWLVGWSRTQMTDAADRLFAPLSFGAIALVGLWLALRGARALWRTQRRAGGSHDHGHHHGHHDHDHHDHGHHDHHHDHAHHGDGEVCDTCGHAHGPDPEALAKATGPREVAMLILAVAIRPCTGALFLLILTAQLGVFWAGVLGTLAMALGTASVTVAVALAAVGLRQGVLAGLAGGALLARVQPWIELAVGLIIAVLATQLAVAML